LAERIKNLHDFFGMPTRNDFTSWKTFINSPVSKWIFFIFFASLVAVLTKFSIGGIPSGLVEGAIASRDIKADQNYEIIDKEATEKLKQEAVSKVVPVYDYQEDTVILQLQKIDSAFEKVRDYLEFDWT